MKSYCILTPYFPNKESFRGSYLLDQAKAIQKHSSYDVKVIVFNSIFSQNFKPYIIEGIRCYYFGLIDFPSFIFPGFFNKLNLMRFGKFLNNYGFKISSSSIIHTHINYPSTTFINYFKSKYNSKTILQHHGLDILQYETGIKIPILKTIQNKFLKKWFFNSNDNIDYHIVISQRMKTELLKIDSSLIDKIKICINGVDTSKFYKLNQPKNNNNFIIGCIANFWKLKDHITLLKAVNILKMKGYENIQLKLVGSGETLSTCKSFVNNHNIDCEFIESIDHNQLNTFYNSLDLFVMPSYYEALGCVYLEALACGIPFIGVENQGVEDIVKVDHKQLQLIKKENFLQLSEKIEYFMTNEITINFNDDFDINHTIPKLLSEF